MKRGYASNRTYKVRLQSGMWGIRRRLRTDYLSLADWRVYATAYGLVEKLNGKSIGALWKENPIIEGGVNPADHRRAIQ